MKQKNCHDSGQLSLGTAEQTIARNALLIIKTHKQSCKELLAYCDNIIPLTPGTIEFIKNLEKQTIDAIEHDLMRVDFVYNRYNKCLYHFIDIIQARVERKVQLPGNLPVFNKAKVADILLNNIFTFQTTGAYANHCSYLY